MSQFKEVAVGSHVYFWFAANTTAGAAGDGATPLYDVRAAGAASNAAPTASGTPTLLSHANYTDGLHEIDIDTTGYSVGEYAVFCTITISSVNPAGFVGSFLVTASASTSLDLLATILSRVGTPSDLGGGATVAANLVVIEGQTDDIGAAGAGLTALATQASVDDIPTNAELATALAAADDAMLGAIAALNNITAAQAKVAVFTGVVEAAGNITLQQAMSILLAANAGVTTDAGATMKTPDGSATRIAGTVNGSNERTAITLTPSA